MLVDTSILSSSSNNTHPKKCRVAIIGGGASGITTAKCLREDNHEPIIFEKSDQIGGVWVFKNTSGGAFNSLRLQNSKYSTAFSDYPMPENISEFPHHTEVIQYLNDYVDTFKLRDCIRLCTTVEKITRRGDIWEVTTDSKEGRVTHNFDAVAVTSGLYHESKLPHIPGEEKFGGTIIHAKDYKEPSIFAGKNIVVLGNGPSGVDIAVAASYTAKKVFWSFRRNNWFFPRYVSKLPVDFSFKRIYKFLPDSLISWIVKFKFLQLTSEHKDCNILPEFNILKGTPVVNDNILNLVKVGAIRTKPGISHFAEGRVIFDDESTVEADIIIYATGYRISLPFFEPSIIQTNSEGLDLYKHVFHPGIPSCAFIGFLRVSGGLFPCAELQARWFSKVLSQEVSLPNIQKMKEEIENTKLKQQKKWIFTGDRSFHIIPFEYMDDIASQINVHPRFWRHWKLAWYLLTGPMLASQYRLDGSNKWDFAEEWISNVTKKVYNRNNFSAKKHIMTEDRI